MGASEALEANIREKVHKLEQFCDGITACRVVVESRHRNQHKGNLFQVRVDLTIPGRELVASRDQADNHAHEDAYVAVRDAFEAVRRQLDKHVRSNRRGARVHNHVETRPPLGRVKELVPMEDFGRILTSDEREIYFHRNSLVNGDFDRLQIGDSVRFAEEMGDDGPQASSVHLT
jgi:ribosomal subunit interface protein